MTEFWTLIWEILVGTNDPNLHLAMAWQAAAISAGASLLGGKKRNRDCRYPKAGAAHERH